MNALRASLLALLVLPATACAGGSGTPSATSPGADPAGSGPAPVAESPEDTERRYYEAKCGVCHVPFARTDYAPSEWPDLVQEFGPRAGLNQKQRARILRYLTAR